MKFLVSLLGLGTTVGGVFIGSIQQNVLKTEKPYIDFLFEKIEKDIRDFSNRNPLTKTESDYIKGITSSSKENQTRKKRNTKTSEEAKPENTLGVWTNIWIGLLSNYIHSLWTTNNMTSSTTIDEMSKNFSNQQKEQAIEAADKQKEEEKIRLEQKLSGKETKIESIYRRMKEFILQIEFPETYEYNTSTSSDGPYENYILKIS